MIEGKPDDAAMEWAENELEKDALRERISRLTAERDAALAERDALREVAEWLAQRAEALFDNDSFDAAWSMKLAAEHAEIRKGMRGCARERSSSAFRRSARSGLPLRRSAR